MQWRQQCALDAGRVQQRVDEITYEINHTRKPDPQGRVAFGWVSDPVVGGKFRIFCHPKSDRVQVDRPPRRPRVTVPNTPLSEPSGVTYVVLVTLRDDRATLHARRSIWTLGDALQTAEMIARPLTRY